MRINKYIAQAGIASRRKADELIANGNVKINGAVMKEPGYDVQDGDKVEVNGKLLSGLKKMEYVLINKPLGMVTTVDDERMCQGYRCQTFPCGQTGLQHKRRPHYDQ